MDHVFVIVTSQNFTRKIDPIRIVVGSSQSVGFYTYIVYTCKVVKKKRSMFHLTYFIV